METQTYANHRHRPRLWSTGAIAAVVAFGLLASVTLGAPTRTNVALLLLAYAAVIAIYTLRAFSLRLQDRIIRLEMQTRLARLGREADLARLTLRQIIALRFASEAELPALIQRAAAENLSADQIKRAVTAWQPDNLRT
jgi:hypothetical protein